MGSTTTSQFRLRILEERALGRQYPAGLYSTVQYDIASNSYLMDISPMDKTELLNMSVGIYLFGRWKTTDISSESNIELISSIELAE